MTSSGLAMACGAALWALAWSGLAHEEHDHEVAGQGAHVHGLGRLDLAQEGPEIHLGLEVPAASLIGFEHAPRRDVERVALEKAVAALKDGPALFRLTEAARCTLAEVAVESALLEPGNGARDHDQHQHQHQGQLAEGHADILAEYRFVCADPAALRGVHVMLFERFPALERLQAQVVTDRAQAGAELTPGAPDLKL